MAQQCLAGPHVGSRQNVVRPIGVELETSRKGRTGLRSNFAGTKHCRPDHTVTPPCNQEEFLDIMASSYARSGNRRAGSESPSTSLVSTGSGKCLVKITYQRSECPKIISWRTIGLCRWDAGVDSANRYLDSGSWLHEESQLPVPRVAYGSNTGSGVLVSIGASAEYYCETCVTSQAMFGSR